MSDVRRNLIEDLDNMQEAMTLLTDHNDIWQNRIIFWVCKAIHDLVQLKIREIDQKK